MDKNDLVSVYQAANAIEATVLKNLLEESGIPAAVSEPIEPFAGSGIDPPDVMVRRADEVRAREILSQYDQERSSKQTAPDWKCPHCGAMVPATFDECDQCGTSRPGAA
ncbi:MAG: DUF2007 domain-containing protein [Planctomycetia bacterium]|nr:DUF2007 domain-containing protein [Planctomycetia bacterium]